MISAAVLADGGRRATCHVMLGNKNNIQLVEDQANPDIVG